MSAGVRVRPAGRAELDLLPGIERRAAELFRTVGYDFCADGAVRSAAEILAAFESGDVLLADSAGTAVGFALVVPLDGAAHLLELGVEPAHQGRGIGRGLVDAVARRARAAGHAELTLTTFRDVPWNAPAYRRMGFEVFVPGPERPGLRAVQADERAHGFAVRPRVAMRRSL